MEQLEIPFPRPKLHELPQPNRDMVHEELSKITREVGKLPAGTFRGGLVVLDSTQGGVQLFELKPGTTASEANWTLDAAKQQLVNR